MDRLPPGPAENPFRQAVAFGQDPYGYLTKMSAKFGEVWTMRLPGNAVHVVVSDPALVRQIFAMKADEYEACRSQVPLNLGAGSLLLLDGDRHARDRKLLFPALHGERLRGYAREMHEVTEHAIRALAPGAPIDVLRFLQDITLEILLRCVFGAKDEAAVRRVQGPVEGWLGTGLTPASFFAGALLGWRRVQTFFDDAVHRADERRTSWLAQRLPWNRAGQAKSELMALLREDLERCRRDGTEGRVDILATLSEAKYEDGTPIALDHAVDELATMLVGGHETTANTLAWTLLQLLSRPEIKARAVQEVRDAFGAGPVVPDRAVELKYVDACLKETMRKTPIAPAVARCLAADYTLGSWRLPKGAFVFPAAYLLHHRPDLWKDPQAFMPERFLEGAVPTDRYFPFGGGRRTCIGMAFAYFEMRIVLTTLLLGCDLSLTDDTVGEPMFRGLTVAPKSVRARIAAAA